MTLLFRTRPGPKSPGSPPSPSVSAWDDDSQKTEEDEDEEQQETEDKYEQEQEETEDEQEYDFVKDDFDPYNPISSPFMSPGFSKKTEPDREKTGHVTILALVAAALRKSLLVTCSVHRDDTSSATMEAMEISCPTDVRHVCHVTFDRFHGFLGLPVELQPEVPKKVPSASASVFGVSPQSMQCSVDERGNSVPTILLLMQKRLYQGGGLQAEGIFRINPENTQEEHVRKQLNKGVVPRGMDVHCLAGLIKAWFRELPKGVLDSLTPEQVMHCNTEEECTQLVKLLPPTEAALLDWAINLMADVVQNEDCNKMNARNIAMVFAPNMTQMADPLTALIHAVQVMNLLKTLIVRTLRLRDKEPSTTLATLLSSPHTSSPRTTPSHPTKTSTIISSNKPHRNKKYLRSMTLDRPEFSPEKKHRKTQQKHTKNANNNDDDRARHSYSFSGYNSPVMSMDQVETGMLRRLSFRKGMRKLCRHPIFQLSK